MMALLKLYTVKVLFVGVIRLLLLEFVGVVIFLL